MANKTPSTSKGGTTKHFCPSCETNPRLRGRPESDREMRPVVLAAGWRTVFRCSNGHTHRNRETIKRRVEPIKARSAAQMLRDTQAKRG